MKTLPVTALVCALMTLTRATAPLPAPDKDQAENTVLFKKWACPGRWTMIGGRCFRYVHSPKSWAEAERYCLLMGAHLASIHSASEYHDIQRMIVTATHDYRETWVGGTDSQQNGIWFWSDGSKFRYTRWCPGEPNNWHSQGCLQMNHSGRKCWDDYYCSRHLPSVCAMAPK